MNQQILENAEKIFREGSVTYFNSTQLFPKEIRDEVTILYSFVRLPDDYVDANPQQKEKFFEYKDKFIKALNGTPANDLVIDPFIKLMEQKKIDKSLPLKFLTSMEQDLNKSTYQTLEELEEYMEGSAEVVGLMMARIMELPKDSYHFAKMLSKSMQFINFIRDINHDLTLNRIYVPKELLEKYQIQSLNPDEIKNYSKEFTQLVRDLINLYYEWQLEAEGGYKYIPSEYLLPVKTAADLYKWTAQELYLNPFIIYEKRLKPTPEIIEKVITNNNLTIKQFNNKRP